MAVQVNPRLLELLVCPVAECRGKLALRGERLACPRCGRAYRVEAGIPVLIPDEAERAATANAAAMSGPAAAS